jgi:hypothetical protein
MKVHKTYFTAILAFILALSYTAAKAQCSPPENLSITVNAGPPTTVTVSWDPPSSGQVVGYLVEYSINGGPMQSLYLPIAPTSYTFTLPTNWQNIVVDLFSICANGSISTGLTARADNIIIMDMVLANSAKENIVCRNNPCANSGYFYYSQGAGIGQDDLPVIGAQVQNLMTAGILPSRSLNLTPTPHNPPGGPFTYESFQNAAFCTCMANTGELYNNNAAVNTCKVYGRDLFSTTNNIINICTPPRKREDIAEGDPFEMILAPNPAIDYLDVILDTETEYDLKVFTATGQLVADRSAVKGAQRLDLNDAATGIYILHVSDRDGQLMVRKFIKQ